MLASPLMSRRPDSPAQHASAPVALPPRRPAGLPIFLGYVPVGAAFGIARAHGGLHAAAGRSSCSALVLAGAGQFIALVAHARRSRRRRDRRSRPASSTCATCCSARRCRRTCARRRCRRRPSLAFTLTDETFAVNIADHRRGHGGRLRRWSASAPSPGRAGWPARCSARCSPALVGDPAAMGRRLRDARDVHRAARRAGRATAATSLVGALAARARPRPARSCCPASWFLIGAAMAAATVGAVVYR